MYCSEKKNASLKAITPTILIFFYICVKIYLKLSLRSTAKFGIENSGLPTGD